MAVLALGVAIYCRPVGIRAWAEEGPAKIAMMTLATLWFSPVVWSYHFVAATPVLAILLLRGRYRWQWVVPVVVVWGGALGPVGLRCGPGLGRAPVDESAPGCGACRVSRGRGY